MYIRDLQMLNVFLQGIPRQVYRYNFRTETYQSDKFKSSPYFKGSTLWDNLPLDVLRVPTLCEFKTRVRRVCSPFSETLL